MSIYDDREDGQDAMLEEDLFTDRNIDNDDLIDGLDLDGLSSSREHEADFSNFSRNSGGGCLLLVLALPAAVIMLLMLS